jgi:predicted RNase H-like HicB family nuclease
MAEVIVGLAQREDGKYIAASTASPYFCFEAETEAAVKQKVEAALAIYIEVKKSARSRHKPDQETKITVTRVRPFSRFRRPILEVA